MPYMALRKFKMFGQEFAHSAILQQVTNGVAIRMAVMYLVAGVTEKGK